MADQKKAQQQNVVASRNVIDVFSANPDLAFDPAQVQAINAGSLVLVGPGTRLVPSPPVLRNFGCIKQLRYGKGDEDLTRVEFDSGDVLRGPPNFPVNAENLNDFRIAFKNAADFGHGVSACHDLENHRIFMVNLHPCKCTCEKREQQTPQVPLPPPIQP